MRLTSFRAARLAAVLGGLVLGHPASAVAALEVSSSIEPRQVVHGTTPIIRYRLDLQAGDAPERFWVQPESLGPFAAPEMGRGSEGGAFGRSGFRTEGDLKLEGGSTGVVAERQPCGQHVGRHGTEYGIGGVDASLPAGGRGAIVYELPPGPDAPWSANDLGLRFVVHGRDANGALTPPIATSTPPLPELAGRRGVKIVMSASPRLATDAYRPFSDSLPDVAGNVPITFEGRTIPPLPGELLTLRAYREDPPPEEVRAVPVNPPQVIGTVRINASGGFRFTDFRPGTPGRYEVWATYASARPDFTDDYVCPLGFDLASPGPPEDVTRITAQLAPGRTVRVRVACPTPADACRGGVRLVRAGTARRGRRSAYDVRAGRPRTVRLAIPKRRVGEGTLAVEISERSPRPVVRRVPLR